MKYIIVFLNVLFMFLLIADIGSLLGVLILGILDGNTKYLYINLERMLCLSIVIYGIYRLNKASKKK